MKITLCYIDEPLGDAFQQAFNGVEGVSVMEGDICKMDADAIVSPANSFGFMDGGLDFALSERFGWDLQKRLQQAIKNRPIRELLVGEVIFLETGDDRVPWLISAPTMRVPMRLRQTINAYLAMKAILSSVLSHLGDPQIKHVAIPGLGTGVGYLSPNTAANQMKKAYDEIVKNDWNYPESFDESQKGHFRLNPDEINIWDP